MSVVGLVVVIEGRGFPWRLSSPSRGGERAVSRKVMCQDVRKLLGNKTKRLKQLRTPDDDGERAVLLSTPRGQRCENG